MTERLQRAGRAPDARNAGTGEDPTLLFQQYVDAFEGGAPPPEEPLYARAGAGAPELARRIAVYRTLRELAERVRAEPPDDDAAPVLRSLGRFRDLAPLGRGGQARVFSAEDPALGRRVAIKVLDPGLIATRDARAWMANEGRSLGRLEHPGVVRVFEIGEVDGHACVVMELVPGPSLHAVLVRMRELAAEDGAGPATTDAELDQAARALETITARTRLGLAIARALAYCHAQGVVHRDVKPGNVLLGDGLAPRLIDFGLAHRGDDASRIDVTQELVGTPAYLAPEQVDGQRTGASAASDQFALGTVLYELLTLVQPFARATRHETTDAVSRALPAPPSKVARAVPADLERIVLHALERRPQDRYPTVAELADDLEAFLEHRAISLASPPPWKAVALWARRNAREVRVSVIASAAFVLAAAVTWAHRQAEDRRAHRARVDSIAGSADRLTSPDEFVSAFDQLQRYEADAVGLDDELYSRWFDGGAAIHARAAVDRCSLAMSRAMEATRPEPPHTSEAKRNRLQEWIVAWRPALARERIVCPECPHNIDARGLGTLRPPALPAGHTMTTCRWKLGATGLPGAFDLVEVPFPASYAPGDYRLRRFDEDGRLVGEIDVEVLPENPTLQVILGEVPETVRRSLVPVGATRVGPEGAPGTAVAAFRYSPLVTWAQLGQTFDAARVERAKAAFAASTGEMAADGEPAVLPFEDASEYASALGLRLPTTGEWLAIVAHDPSVWNGAGHRLHSELLAARENEVERLCAAYQDGPVRPELPFQPYRIRGQLRFAEGQRRGTGFRMVLSGQ